MSLTVSKNTCNQYECIHFYFLSATINMHGISLLSRKAQLLPQWVYNNSAKLPLSFDWIISLTLARQKAEAGRQYADRERNWEPALLGKSWVQEGKGRALRSGCEEQRQKCCHNFSGWWKSSLIQSRRKLSPAIAAIRKKIVIQRWPLQHCGKELLSHQELTSAELQPPRDSSNVTPPNIPLLCHY